MADNLAWPISVLRRGGLTALSMLLAAGTIAIFASTALASDTSGLTLTATAAKGMQGAPLTVTYMAPASRPIALSAATLRLPISWNPRVTPEFNTDNALGTVTITLAAGTQLIGQITVTDQNNAFTNNPMMVVTFPGSAGIPGFVVTGKLDVTNQAITFTGFPNLAFTSVVVALSPGRGSPASVKCQLTPGMVSSTVTGQDGSTNELMTPLLVNECPPAVTGGKLIGAGRGKPALSFSVAATDGGTLTRLTVKLPEGLSFASGKVHKGGKAVAISGGQIGYLKGVRRKLLALFTAPTARLTVRVKPGALAITKALQNKIKTHKTKSLSVRVGVTGTSRTLSLSNPS